MELQREPVGAPERLDVPFELKAIQTLTGDDGVEVGIFEGLASTFGNQDMVGDVVEPGALAATIARPGRIKMLWQHDARAPIGVWDDIRETAAGLEVKGRLVLQVQRAREALALLKAGAVDALSIGFSVMRGGAEFDRERGLRRIKAVELWETGARRGLRGGPGLGPGRDRGRGAARAPRGWGGGTEIPMVRWFNSGGMGTG